MEDVVKAGDTLGRLYEASSEQEVNSDANVCVRARFEMAWKSTFITTRLMVWRLAFPSALYVLSSL
jgi:hypothetical protein